MDEEVDDLDADEDSMKNTFNLSVSLQKDGMHLVYECASIDHHVPLYLLSVAPHSACPVPLPPG